MRPVKASLGLWELNKIAVLGLGFKVNLELKVDFKKQQVGHCCSADVY